MNDLASHTVSLAPKTRRNHTARGIATLFEYRSSNKSWPLAPWGTLLPSLCRGISGFAKSANQACRLASFKVTLVGILKVDCLNLLGLRWRFCRRQGNATHGIAGIWSARRMKISFIIPSSTDRLSGAIMNFSFIILLSLKYSTCEEEKSYDSTTIKTSTAYRDWWLVL